MKKARACLWGNHKRRRMCGCAACNEWRQRPRPKGKRARKRPNTSSRRPRVGWKKCGGTYYNGPDKRFAVCDRCGKKSYEKYEGDKCLQFVFASSWSRKRQNPSMVLLYNPIFGRRKKRTSIPSERDARAAWSEFHEAPADRGRVIEVPDIRGLPKTVMSLGVCEGFELVDRRWARPSKQKVVTFNRSPSSTREGPWLVTNPEMDTLWIIAGRSYPDQRKLREADGEIMRAIYYWPPPNSGKHDPERAFRHEFGETGEGGRPKRNWPTYYPRCRLLGPRALLIKRPLDGYTIEDRGIVG